MSLTSRATTQDYLYHSWSYSHIWKKKKKNGTIHIQEKTVHGGRLSIAKVRWNQVRIFDILCDPFCKHTGFEEFSCIETLYYVLFIFSLLISILTILSIYFCNKIIFGNSLISIIQGRFVLSNYHCKFK